MRKVDQIAQASPMESTYAAVLHFINNLLVISNKSASVRDELNIRIYIYENM